MNVTFQNFVNKMRLTQGMINFCVIVYMDDILVYLETYHRHAQHIEWTQGALRDAGFKISLENSEFLLSEISFLGYVVTRRGLRPDSRKVAAVKDAPIPMSLTQVRAFLGLASYYRRFIKGFAAIARPLTNLLRKDQPLSWDAECEQAFTTLKDALTTTPILIRPDPTKQFILITDWQPEAIFAILTQKGNDDREHVIESASRTVPDKRRNDSAPQGECYAVVWGIQHFHPYLYGQKFLLVIDHEPLLALKRLTNYTGMIGRWAVRLQEYDFDIIYRKTERHDNADRLTRLHRPAKLVDDLPLDIISPCDESPVPHVLSRRLTSYLQWSTCLEDRTGGGSNPSRAEYLNPRGIIDILFFSPRTTVEERVVAEEAEVEDESEEETSEEAGSYSEYSEEESGEEEEEEEEDQLEEEEESEWETLGEEADRTETQEEDPEVARRREEIAAGKQPLKFESGADLPISNDPGPTEDPEPPQNDDGDPTTEASSTSARRRQSRSRSPSPRPPVRARVDAGHRASSPMAMEAASMQDALVAAGFGEEGAALEIVQMYKQQMEEIYTTLIQHRHNLPTDLLDEGEELVGGWEEDLYADLPSQRLGVIENEQVMAELGVCAEMMKKVKGIFDELREGLYGGARCDDVEKCCCAGPEEGQVLRTAMQD
ncbi:hypothetical protein CBR_g46219 [Chara braunii]|uniref:Reverse transcriptase domain-containing protein n=1 Tax=Chara braunii TaxID=69332 RepID=A0A388K3Q4_CHABU|nr:hypothetical protein CBR_g46219 [Chara braunii]|eukprot:GBG64677.1 hypothetical protein CBR_g46219 [Chara braunii]